MNFLLKAAITTSIVFSTSSFANVDYSKCSEYLSPRTPFGGGFASIYQPFQLESDGKITPHEDVISYNHDRTKNQEIIVYELPTYEFSTLDQNNMQNPYKQKMRRVTAIIQRNENGQITEITNDQNITQSEIDKQVKLQRDLYLKNTPPEVVKQHEEMYAQNGLGSHLPFLRLDKQTTNFEIKNDQCVPVDSKNHFLIEPKADGSTYESKLFDINLCKDIDSFIEQNPEAAACFKKNLNEKISAIFQKYSPPQPTMPGGGFPGMGMGLGGSFPGMGYMGYTGISGGFGMMSRLDSQLLTNFGILQGNEEQVDNFRKMTGSSPVITGHMILQECHTNGLTSFIDDEDIWEEQAAPSTPINESDSSSREI